MPVSGRPSSQSGVEPPPVELIVTSVAINARALNGKGIFCRDDTNSKISGNGAVVVISVIELDGVIGSIIIQ